MLPMTDILWNKQSSTNVISCLIVTSLFFVSGFALVVTSSLAVAAPTFSTPINLSNDSGNAQEPNVQTNGSYIYVTWTQLDEGIYFRVSNDTGSVWFPPVSLEATRLSNKLGVASYPLMAAYGSYVYVVWSQTPKEDEPAQIYIAVSSDNGYSFSTAAFVDNDASVAQLTPVIATWGSDVYVAWSQDSHSYVAASTNNGASFGTPFEYSTYHEPQLAASGSYGYAIADGGSLYVNANNGATGDWIKVSPKDCCGAEPWIMASGSNVVATWETKTNQSQIYATSSQNYGKIGSWSAVQNLSPGVNDSWAPMLGIQGSQVVIAWRTNPGGTLAQEYIVASNNAGVSWSAPLNIGLPSRINAWPFTVSVSNGNVFTMWSEKVNSNNASTAWQTLAEYGSYNGSAWSFSSPPTSLTGSNPTFGAMPEQDIATGAIIASSTNAYAVWQNNATTSQIYFSAS